MIAFWAVALILLAGTLGLFLWVLTRGRGPAMARAEYDIAVFRDQLSEVERDLERGILAADQAEAARIEIKRRMLAAAADGGFGEESAVSPAVRGAGLALITVIVPVSAIGMYLFLGSPNVPDQPLAARQGAIQAEQQRENQMNGLVTKLAAQLAGDPSNAEGWLLLGRSYRTIEKYTEAIESFRKGIELAGRDPGVLAEYGELLVLAHSGTVPDVAVEVFSEVSGIAPGEPRTHYYLGIHKAQQGDARGAVQSWVDLIAVSPAGAPWLADVRGRIQTAATAANIDMATVTPTPGLPKPPVVTAPPAQSRPAASPEPSEARGPSADDVKNAAEMTKEERDDMIRSMVEGLAARLEDEPGDADGWRRLAQAYRVLGEIDKAADAMARAVAADKKPQ